MGSLIEMSSRRVPFILASLIYFLALPRLTLQHGNLCMDTPPEYQTKCDGYQSCSPSNLLSCYMGRCCANSVISASILRKMSDQCEDVSIIGAGVGGTYAAWRLRQHGLRIGVHEYSDRVGGKMFTRHFAAAPDLNLDFGAMRVIVNEHRRMTRAIRELGLPLVDFPEGTGIPERTLYYFRNRHVLSHEFGGPKTPYNLRPNEYLSPDNLKLYLSSCLTNYTAAIAGNTRELFNVVTYDGCPLYQQSYIQAALKKISIEAYQYIRDVTTFYTLFGDTQATEILPFAPSNSTSDVRTIGTGMNSLPNAFLHNFLQASPRHRFYANRKLIKIRKNALQYYDVYFKLTRTVAGYTEETGEVIRICSKKVIMAIPKTPLQHVDWPPMKFPVIAEALDSVYEAKASKVFLLYDYPWWRKIPLNYRHTRSDLPNRQTYDFGVSANGKAVLLVSYADDGDVEFWRQLQNKGSSASFYNDRNRVTTEVIKQAHIQISQIYNINIKDIPPALDGMMMTWDSYPFNGAWSTWKPGYNWLDIKRMLTKISDNDCVYIIHGHYGAEYSGWGEGALQAADVVLQHFGIEPYAPLESV